MALTTYPQTIESPLGSGYEGSMDAKVFELNELAQPTSTQQIRTSQDWGVTVFWEMHGPSVLWEYVDFNADMFLDVMGPGTDFGPYSVGPINSFSSALTADGQRLYQVDIPVAAGLPVGVYEIAVVLQPTSTTALGTHKLPFASIVTVAPVSIYQTP